MAMDFISASSSSPRVTAGSSLSSLGDCEMSPTNQDSSNSPLFFGLKKLSRSPEVILAAKRAKSSVEKMESDFVKLDSMDEKNSSWMEWEIQWRIYYLNIIEDLKKSIRCNPNISVMFEELEELEEYLTEARATIDQLNKKKEELVGQLQLAKQDKECVAAMMEEHEKLAFLSLKECQEKLRESKLKVGGKTSLPRRVFYPPSSPSRRRSAPDVMTRSSDLGTMTSTIPDVTQPPPPLLNRPGTSCLQFTNLFALSNQLAEFCQGEHGSNFVVRRLLEGTEPERRLVRQELGLPKALVVCLGNKHCRKVVKVLVKTDNGIKQELVKQAKEDIEFIMKMDLDSELIQLLVLVPSS